MLDNIIRQTAEELGLPFEYVRSIYYSYWSYVKKRIRQLPLKGDITPEEFDRLKVNVNIPSLGKLYCDKKNLFSRKEYLKNKSK